MKRLYFTLCSFLLASPVFADEATEVTRDRGSFMQTLIMIGIAIVFFYFILWRPEQKRRKSMEKLRNTMKKGDSVTAMGIVGTIDRVKEQTVIIRNVDGSKMEVLKGAISEVKSPTEETEKEKEDSSST